MADFILSNVDVIAVSLCKRGANGKRFFLKKMEAGEDDTGVAVIQSQMLFKTGDWRVVYSVVAEPGNEERQGIAAGADPTKTDVWASDEEILKAAHGFMGNGGRINFAHRSLDPVGRVVENWIAPADFDMVDPAGVSQTIRKGSWVIGIEPNADLRQLIDAGEVDSVSYEGTGMRTPVAKGHDNDSPATHKKCPKCGGKMARDKKTCQNCGTSHVHKAGHPVAGPAPGNPVKNLIDHYMKKPHPFTACVRDNTKRFGPDRAQRVCARLKDMGRHTTGWRGGMKKADADAMYDLMEANWYEAGLTDADAIVALEDAMAREDRSLLEKIADKLGISTDEASDDHHEEDDVPLTDQEKAALAKVEGIESKLGEVEAKLAKVEDLDAKLATLLERVPEPEKTDEEEREELAEALQKSLESVTSMQERLAKLEQGRSTQGADSIKKTDDPDAALAHALFG